MSDDEQNVVVCMRVTDNGVIYPGAAMVRCDMCDHDVWVSPASQLLLAEGATARCMNHIKQVPQEGFQVDPRTAAEIVEWFENPDTAPKIEPR